MFCTPTFNSCAVAQAVEASSAAMMVLVRDSLVVIERLQVASPDGRERVVSVTAA